MKVAMMPRLHNLSLVSVEKSLKVEYKTENNEKSSRMLYLDSYACIW